MLYTMLIIIVRSILVVNPNGGPKKKVKKVKPVGQTRSTACLGY